MRIATWNINSINPRLAHLESWITGVNPDVLCLQETKCADADFPREALLDLGYESAHLGDGRWNGVAILSRVGLADVRTGLTGQPAFEGKQEPRAIGATCGGLRVWSLYIPNGREVTNPHYAYKLAWLEAVAATAREELSDRLVMLGDFNVAPTDVDVWDREAFEGATHVTAAERAKLADLAAVGLREIQPRPLNNVMHHSFGAALTFAIAHNCLTPKCGDDYRYASK